MYKFVIYLVLVVLLIVVANTQAFSQGFKGIVPLESTCEDVKRILGVAECTFPRGTYWMKDYVVSVGFIGDRSVNPDRSCYVVPAGRVISVNVSYNKPIPLAQFDYKLVFAETLANDVGSTIFENIEKGVTAYVQNGTVTSAIFTSSPDLHKRYACKSVPASRKTLKRSL